MTAARCAMRAVIILSSALLSVFVSAQAQPVGSSMDAKKVIASCVAIEPWGDEPTQTGVGCLYLQYLGMHAGLSVQADARPLARVEAGLRNGSIDITMMPIGGTGEGSGLSVCEPTRIRLLLAHYKQDGMGDTGASYSGKRISMPPSVSHLFDSFFAAGALRENANTMTQGFKMLQAGRVEAVACSQPGCEEAIKAAHLDPRSLDFIAVDDLPVAVLVSRHSRLAEDQASLDELRTACGGNEGLKELRNLLEK